MQKQYLEFEGVVASTTKFHDEKLLELRVREENETQSKNSIIHVKYDDSPPQINVGDKIEYELHDNSLMFVKTYIIWGKGKE